jgi:hypothetical protein
VGALLFGMTAAEGGGGGEEEEEQKAYAKDVLQEVLRRLKNCEFDFNDPEVRAALEELYHMLEKRGYGK